MCFSQNLKISTSALIFAGSVIPANADFVINDDLIVDGSECVGFDCVNGENFGFDTIKLKENNLRIKFDDTSSAASFPRNDWQIRINDSVNGGDSYFAVEDVTGGRTPFRINASSPSNSLFVDSQGDVGLGTSNPVLELDIKDGDTPSVRLQQDGTSGWSPQTWDLAGNETSFFIRDVTNGSSLPFRLRPGAPSGSLDIAGTGDVGIGTSNPATKLHVVGGDGTLRISDVTGDSSDKNGFIASSNYDNSEEEFLALRMLSNNNSNQLYIGGGSSVYNAASFILFNTGSGNNSVAGQERMRINPNGKIGIATVSIGTNNILEVGTDTTNGNGASLTNAGVWTNGSSRANKIDISALEASKAIETVMQLEPVTYRGKQEPEEEYVGFIAEDVPNLVAMNERKGIAAIEIVAVLTKVVKEQQRTIAGLTERLEKLESQSGAIQD